MVYPIGFTYRHALELALKDANLWVESWINGKIKNGVVDERHGLPDEVIDREILRHQLEPLLDRLQRRLIVVADFDWLEPVVRTAVAAFHLFDVNAERFRYPFLSRGQGPSFEVATDFRSIDLVHFRAAIDPAIKFLTSSLRDALEADLEVRAELERAWKVELARLEAEREHERAMAADRNQRERDRWLALTGKRPEDELEEYLDWSWNNSLPSWEDDEHHAGPLVPSDSD